MATINPAYELLEKQLRSVMEDAPSEEEKERNPEYVKMTQELAKAAPTQFQDVTFLDKVSEAAKKRGGEITETFSDYITAPSGDVTQTWESYYKTKAPDTLQALTQVAGNIVALGFDVAVAGLTESAENLWQLAPENFRNDVSSGAKEAAQMVAKTTVGKAIINAAQISSEELKKYEENYPQEYKTMAAGLNIAALGRPVRYLLNEVSKIKPTTEVTTTRRSFSDFENTPLEGEFLPRQAVGSTRTPSADSQTSGAMSWRDFSARQQGDKLSGRDKDIWAVIQDESTPAVKKAIEEGRYTPPSFLGTESRLLSFAEELQLAAVKKIKDFGTLDTYRQNYKAIKNQLESVSRGIEEQLSNVKGSFTWSEIDVAFQDALTKTASKFKTEYSKQTTLANFEQMTFKAKEFIDEFGTSALGMHKARVAFSRYFNQYRGSFAEEGVSQQIAEVNFKTIYRKMNEMVDSLDGGVTQQSRLEQSGLIQAGQTVLEKATLQDRTAIGRFLQSVGITSHGKTSAGKYASIRSDIPLLLVSPFYFLLKPIRKATTQSKPVREGVQNVAYSTTAIKRDPKQAFKLAAEELKALRTQGASAIKEITDKETQKALISDIKTLTVLIKSLEEGTYDPTEEEQRIINEWLTGQ